MRSLFHHIKFVSLPILLTVVAMGLGCQDKKQTTEVPANNQEVSGAWVLKSRIVEDQEVPATDRIMKLQFNANGTFQASYKGDSAQNWVKAGKGGFQLIGRHLTLYWESGQSLTLTILEKTDDRMRVHHGRGLVPLLNQEPDEIFVKQQEKGPTK